MTKGQVLTERTIFFLLLAASAAVHLFIFPLPGLAGFAAAALIPFLFARQRYIFDPVSGIWEGSPVSGRQFGSWAVRVTSSDRYRKDLSVFLRNETFKRRVRFEQFLSVTRARTYIHAFGIVSVLAAALLIFDGYENFFAGYGVAWSSPIVVGAFMGVVWGYAAGLACLRWTTPVPRPSASTPAPGAAVSS
ncbi:MAG TPA: hypothetical protein VKB38_02155 [Terracidiphilus sp.]|nr:hypothetical protein [Terracidiphilus sp.]